MTTDNDFKYYSKNSNRFAFLPDEFKTNKSDSLSYPNFNLKSLSAKVFDEIFLPGNTDYFIGSNSQEGLFELEHQGFDLTGPLSFGKLPAITLSGLRDNTPLFERDKLELVGKFFPILINIDYLQGRNVYGRDLNQKGLIYVTGDLAHQEFTQPQYESIHGVTVEDIKRFPNQLDPRYDIGAYKKVRVDKNPVPEVEIWYKR